MKLADNHSYYMNLLKQLKCLCLPAKNLGSLEHFQQILNTYTSASRPSGYYCANEKVQDQINCKMVSGASHV